MKNDNCLHVSKELDGETVASVVATKRVRGVRGKRGVAIIMVCLIVIGIVLLKSRGVLTVNEAAEITGPTLIGADEIYPTVMVDGKLYQWRRGGATCSRLPLQCVYYGELRHVEGKLPKENGEFVSTFSASGQIYTNPLIDSVYLCLKTEWMDDVTIIAFDLVDAASLIK